MDICLLIEHRLDGIAPATDRPISIPGVNIFRIVNGQIAEEWIVWDTLSWA